MLIFTNEKHILIEQTILEIESYISLNEYAQEYYSVIGGKAGLVLFYYELWRYQPLDIWLDKCKCHLNKCLVALEELPMSLHFGTGVAGILALYNELATMGVVAPDDEGLMEAEQVFIQQIREYQSNKNYDLFTGLIGLGEYFLRSTSKYSNEALSKIIEAIDSLAIKENGTYRWINYPPSPYDTPVLNMGLAHGIPSILSFFADVQIKRPLISNERLEAVMNGAMKYLIGAYNAVSHEKKQASEYPAYFELDGSCTGANSRLAWCYGDIGIGYSMLKASTLLGNAEWETFAKSLLLKTTKRNINNAYITDVPICHGVAGLFHMYNRLYKFTGILQFKIAADYWLGSLYSFRNRYENLDGFNFRKPVDDSGTVFERLPLISLLEGYIGVALSLLSAISTVNPIWDGYLLLNLPLKNS